MKSEVMLCHERKEVEVFLRYRSDSGFQVEIDENKGTRQYIVSRTVWKVVKKFCNNCKDWTKFPQNTHEIEISKTGEI